MYKNKAGKKHKNGTSIMRTVSILILLLLLIVSMIMVFLTA